MGQHCGVLPSLPVLPVPIQRSLSTLALPCNIPRAGSLWSSQGLANSIFSVLAGAGSGCWDNALHDPDVERRPAVIELAADLAGVVPRDNFQEQKCYFLEKPL
jgi:hypothetical protein